MSYFIITNGDGDTYVEEIDGETFLNQLEEGEYGDNPIFLDKLPENIDTNYWDGAYLLIKGEIIKPKPIQVTTKFMID